MPKKVHIINTFHGGISNHADPRDIDDNSQTYQQDCNTSSLGVVKQLSGSKAHVSIDDHDNGSNSGNTAYANTSKVSAGYGAYAFASDKAGFAEKDLWGLHTSGSSEQILTNSAAHWTPSSLVGCRVRNISDTDGEPNGSSGTVTANTNTTVTIRNTLSITAVADNGSGKIRCTCTDHGWVTGNSVSLENFSVVAYNQASQSLTRVDNDTFDITAITYSSNSTGTVIGGLHNPREAGGGTALNTWENGDTYLIDNFPDKSENHVLLANCRDLGGYDDQRIHTFYTSTDEWADGIRPRAAAGISKPIFWQADGRLFVQETDFSIDISGDTTHSPFARDSHLTREYIKYKAGERDENTMSSWSSWVSYMVSNHKRSPIRVLNTLKEITNDGDGPNLFHTTYWDEGTSDNQFGGNTLISLYAGEEGGTWNATQYFVTGKKDSDSDTGETGDFYRLYMTEVNQWGEESKMALIGENQGKKYITAAANSGGTKTTITSNGHLLNDAEKIRIEGTTHSHTNIDGNYTVSNSTANTFDIDLAWADAGSATHTEGYAFRAIAFERPANTGGYANIMMNCDININISEGWQDDEPEQEDSADNKNTSSHRKGFRVYYSHSKDFPNERYLLIEGDIEKGIKIAGQDEAWTPWVHRNADEHGAVASDQIRVSNLLIEHPPLIATFQDENGYKHDEDMVGQYKTAVVVNRVSYVGNVRNNTTGVTYGDVVVKSPINKFSVHPWSNRLEVVPSDGDEIVHLATFADRLLIFKMNALYILNCGGEVEFLESSYKFRGVRHPAAVVTTDVGIAWINKYGCFVFDGEKVTDITIKKGKRLLSIESKVPDESGINLTWTDFYQPGEDGDSGVQGGSIIGYDPMHRHLVIMQDCSGTSAAGTDVKGLVFDLDTYQWMSLYTLKTNNKQATNFFNDKDGNLCWFERIDTGSSDGAAVIKQYDPDQAISTSNFSFFTKDIDFKAPGVNKKIYKVYISYKGDADQLFVKAGINGDNDYLNDWYGFNGTNTPLEDKNSAENMEEWHVAELKPTTAANFNNVKSIRLGIYGTCEDFMINDISIIYRVKNVK